MIANKIIITAVSLLLLGGCAFFGVDPIEVETVATEKTPLMLEKTEAVQMQPIIWSVVTPDNALKVWTEMDDAKEDLVLFCITAKGYENLSLNMKSLKNFIDAEALKLSKYKEYYESNATK
mgnify:CR=1 FL=1|jgi:hypothetical protein